MENVKPWWKSRTVWGGLIALLAGIAGLFGFDLGAEEQQVLTDTALAIAGAAGGLLAVYGRVKASSKVTK